MKYLKYTIILLLLFLILMVVIRPIKADYVLGENIEVKLYKEYDGTYDDIIPLTKDSFIGRNHRSSYYVSSDKEVMIEEDISYSGLVFNGYLYYSTKNNIHLINLITFEKTNLQVNINEPILKIYDNKLYAYGEYEEDAILNVYNLRLEFLNDFIISGASYEKIIDIVFDDSIYLVIHKSCISNGSILKNMNNINYYCSHILKLDYDLNVLDVFYIYLNGSDELIKNIYINNNHLYFILEADNNYFYEVDKDFKEIKRKEINYGIVLIPSLKKDSFLFYSNFDDYKLYQNDEVIYQAEDFRSNKYLIEDGRLYIYTDTKQVKIYEVDEYEIKRFDPKYITREQSDINDTSNIEIESFFEKLEIKVNSYEPYLEKLMAGTYKINYQIDRCSSTIELTGTLIIEPYTNFLDGGIYPKGKVLEFFGEGYLDGKRIYYGQVISSLGEHEIKIIDVSGKLDIYHIMIVDDYYFNNNEGVEPYDACSKMNSYNVYQIELSAPLNIKHLIINNEIYTNFSVQDNYLNIYFSSDKYGIRTYNIEKLIYLDGTCEKELTINKLYKVNYLKDNMFLNIFKELTIKNIDLKYVINDPNQTFLYLVVKCNNKDNTVYSDFNIPSGTSSLNVKMVYSDGSNHYEKELLAYNSDTKIDGRIDFNYNSGSINLIDINVSTPKKLDNIKELSVAEISIADYYNIENSNFIQIMTIIISICIVIFMIIFVIVKKVKKKF